MRVEQYLLITAVYPTAGVSVPRAGGQADGCGRCAPEAVGDTSSDKALAERWNILAAELLRDRPCRRWYVSADGGWIGPPRSWSTTTVAADVHDGGNLRAGTGLRCARGRLRAVRAGACDGEKRVVLALRCSSSLGGESIIST